MEIVVVSRPKKGESVNGDAYFAKEFDGAVLMGVIDGLGHGEEANYASRKALSFLERHFHFDLISLIKGCHAELQGTRGVALGLIKVKQGDNHLTFSGVGNIGARIIGEKSLHLRSMNGIVGHNLRELKELWYPYEGRDIILMFSDGISSRIDLPELLGLGELPAMAERIMQEYSKDEDDATVLLARG